MESYWIKINNSILREERKNPKTSPSTLFTNAKLQTWGCKSPDPGSRGTQEGPGPACHMEPAEYKPPQIPRTHPDSLQGHKVTHHKSQVISQFKSQVTHVKSD